MSLNIALVAQFLPSDSKMGVGYQVHYLANTLVRRGHGVTVFSQSPRPTDALYQVQQSHERPPMRSLRVAWKLRAADWSAFDIVHAHGDDWFLWHRRVPPHVRTVHGSCLAEARHIPGLRNRLHMLWLAGLETLSCAVADRTLGVSKNTCQSYPWIKSYVYDGVDLAAFHPGNKEAAPTILFVGTYHNRKRGALLMDIFARQVRPALPGARLWMVCTDAPRAEGVDILGRLSTDDLADRYRRAWAFCLPSTYEGFGVPYIEAMASGTAAVATPNAGAREVFAEGKWGCLAAEAELGPALIRILQDDGERRSWEQRGLERARDFSWERIADQYEELYAQVIEGAKDRARLLHDH